MRWLVILLVLSLSACSTRLGKDGRTETTVDAKYLIKTEVDRIADTGRAEVMGGLMLSQRGSAKPHAHAHKHAHPAKAKASGSAAH